MQKINSILCYPLVGFIRSLKLFSAHSHNIVPLQEIHKCLSCIYFKLGNFPGSRESAKTSAPRRMDSPGSSRSGSNALISAFIFVGTSNNGVSDHI